jgi:hypothetical protein
VPKDKSSYMSQKLKRNHIWKIEILRMVEEDVHIDVMIYPNVTVRVNYIKGIKKCTPKDCNERQKNKNFSQKRNAPKNETSRNDAWKSATLNKHCVNDLLRLKQSLQ